MRAFVIDGPGRAGVREVRPLAAEPGQVVVDVERVGLCGTDVEFFTGEMAYLHQGHAAYPLRPGHEWCGTVTAVGAVPDLPADGSEIVVAGRGIASAIRKRSGACRSSPACSGSARRTHPNGRVGSGKRRGGERGVCSSS